LRKDVEPGDLATPTKILLTIGNPSLLRVTATVDERDIPRVRRGQRVLMSSDAYLGKVFGGTVRELTPGGNPEQRAFRVRIHPDAPSNLPIGLTLEVNIVNQHKSHVLLAPSGAVKMGAVWTVEEGRARRRPVRVGIEGGERVEIVSGVAAGACILADPPSTIQDGIRAKADGC
jgi:multidrug efflux pump subunit AcrA (membrane-fusion protein)